MKKTSIRLVVEHELEHNLVVLDLSDKDQVNMETILSEFNLDITNWKSYELDLPKLSCKVKNFCYLKDDDFLLLAKIQSKVPSEDFSFQEQESEIFEIMADKNEHNNEDAFSNQEDISYEICSDDMGFSSDRELNILIDDISHVGSEDENPNFEDPEAEVKNEVVDLKELLEIDFKDRQDLKDRVYEWGKSRKMKLCVKTQERCLLKKEVKVTTILCSKKPSCKCPFYLNFRTDPQTQRYKLTNFKATHNHDSCLYDSAASITPAILEKIKALKDMAKDNVELTKTINKEFNMNFHSSAIYYQVRKLKNEEFGNVSKDANTIIKMLEKDSETRCGFFEASYSENKLKNLSYMSKRMKTLTKYFCDVIIIDTTFKTNCFNCPLIDIALVNNHGKKQLAFSV